MNQLKRSVLGSTIRYGVRPLLTAPLSYASQRRIATAATAICLAPKGMQVDEERIGGVPCERVTVGKPGERILIWLHGGGYCVGSCKTDRAPAGQFAKASAATVIVPDYRLAPEHPFPAAPEDALAVYQALLDQGLNPANIIIGGDSAGGGLALTTAVAIRENGLPMPAGLVLCSPWADLRHVQASYTNRSKVDPWLTIDLLERWGGAYRGATPASDPRVSPLLAELSGLPPTLIQVGDREILLDDSVELDRKLHASGVQAHLHVYPEMWHIFFLQAGLLDEADAAVAEIGQFVQNPASF